MDCHLHQLSIEALLLHLTPLLYLHHHLHLAATLQEVQLRVSSLI